MQAYASNFIKMKSELIEDLNTILKRTGADKIFFYQKILIYNFCYRQLCASYDKSFESSSGVDFKYIYTFIAQKLFNYNINSLITLDALLL